MGDIDQIQQVYSYRRELDLKLARGALPRVGDDDWPQTSYETYVEVGEDPAFNAEPPRRAGGWGNTRLLNVDREDVVDPSDLTVGPREVLCQSCWCWHRPEVECL